MGTKFDDDQNPLRALQPVRELVTPGGEREQPYVSRFPSDQPPTYGLDDVNWAWRRSGILAYQDRLDQWRELERQLNKNTHLKVSDLTGHRWCDVTGALFRAFNISHEPVQSFSDLVSMDALHGTTARPMEMTQAGIIVGRSKRPGETGDAFPSFDHVLGMPLDKIAISVPGYMNNAQWPEENRNLMGLNTEVANYMVILVKGESGYRFTFKLEPDRPAGLLHPGYYRFYKELAELGLPGEFDVSGPFSLREVFLFRFDQDHLINPKVSLLPQYEIPQIAAPEAPPVIAKIDSSSTGLTGRLVSLTHKTDRYVLSESDGKIQFEHNGEDFEITDEKKARECLDAALAARINNKFELPIQSFARAIQPPFATVLTDYGIKAELKGILDDVLINKSTGEVDHVATSMYRRIVSVLSEDGAINLETLGESLTQIKKFLTPKQMELIGSGVNFYFVDSLRRGQILDLGGFEVIYEALGETSLQVPPEIADRLRWLYDNVPNSTIYNTYVNISREGYVGFGVRNISVPSDSDSTELSIPQPRIRQYGPGGIELHPKVAQDRLAPRLREYVQSKVPSAEITDDIIRDIRINGEILMIMNGEHHLIDYRINPPLARMLVALLEYSVGTRLEKLREALVRASYKNREVLDALPSPLDTASKLIDSSPEDTLSMPKITPQAMATETIQLIVHNTKRPDIPGQPKLPTGLLHTTLQTSNSNHDLWDHNSLIEKGPMILELAIEQEDNSKVVCNLPSVVAKNLTTYLQNGAPEEEFSCTQFVRYLHGLAYDRHTFNYDEWDFNYFSTQQKLQPGDVLMFADVSEGTADHCAVYIGEGLYLSKYGEYGVGVSDLTSLQQLYPTPDLLHFHRDGAKIPSEIHP